jgi:SAM-dependent methyltransferase
VSTAVATKTVLHLGCGRKKWPAEKLFPYVGLQMPLTAGGFLFEPAEVIHADSDARLEPDMVLDLGSSPIRLPDNSVDTIIAWHMLEHVGRQGETQHWFDAWQEMYRVLKPGGMLYGESPYYSGIWAWSDPTHSRAISEHSFVFFNQDSYRVEQSAISPYRVRCDFQWLGLGHMEKGWAVITDRSNPHNTAIRFALSARKPFLGWWEN